MEGSGEKDQQQGATPKKNPFEEMRKRAEMEGRLNTGPASMGRAEHIEAAKRLLYARNSAEARNVASFVRLTNYAWSGISFALIFSFSMATLYKYFNRKPEPEPSVVPAKAKPNQVLSSSS